MKYKVVRMYFNDSVSNRVVKRGLTLEEAQAHCSDPESSSSTCTNRAGRLRAKRLGPWFDGYDKDK